MAAKHRRPPKRRLRAWWARFGWAEVAGTLAWAGGVGVGLAHGWPLLGSAYAAAWAEMIGFYAVLAARTLPQGWRASLAQAGSAGWAEGIDVLVIRPWCMAALAVPLGALGMLAGKAVADAGWYLAEAPARALITRYRSARSRA